MPLWTACSLLSVHLRPWFKCCHKPIRLCNIFSAGMVLAKNQQFSCVFIWEISSAERTRELLKSSKDSASLRVYNEIKIFGFGFQIFCEWHKWSTFKQLWSTSSGPGPKSLDGRISLKFLLDTRWKSKSSDTLDDLLRFQFQNLWSKVSKIINPIIR